MANCPNCGSELTGPYCNTCGARAPEDRAPKKPKAPQNRPAAAGKSSKGPGLFAPQRIGRTTAMAVLGLALFGAGTVAGYYLGTSNGSSITSTAVDATAAGGDVADTPLTLAGKYMDEGVDYLNKGERTQAAASFRKSIAQYEQVIKQEPNNLYARSYLGLTYYYVGDSKKAFDYEQGVLKQDDKYLWAIFNMAWMYETGDKKDEALLMYKKYLAVADAEKQDLTKYAEQPELIDRQVEAAKQAIANLEGGAKK